MTEEIGARDARRDFSNLSARVKHTGEPVVITRNGKGYVAIVSLEDLELLERIESRIEGLAFAEALADPENHGEVDWEDVKSEAGP